MTRIPTLDPAAAGGASGLAGPLADALADTGFCIVTGHGIDLALIREVRRRVRELFALPPQTLERDRVQRSNYRGYVPLGFFTPNDGGGSDMYAAWKLHWEAPPELAARSPLYGPNRWPPVPGLRDAVLRYWTALDGLAAELLRAAALGLGLPADRFTRWFDAPLTNMTLLRYPETGKERWGIHPHKDFDVLTLLAHDPVGGLQVLARDGEWLDAACPEDGFLVNAGDMLELWSGGRIRSAPHRVLNRSGRERVSFPWFAVPEPEVTIEPLLPPVPGFAREPLNCAEASAAVWYSNWPDAAPPSGIALGEFGDHPQEAARDTGQGNAAGGAAGAARAPRRDRSRFVGHRRRMRRILRGHSTAAPKDLRRDHDSRSSATHSGTGQGNKQGR